MAAAAREERAPRRGPAPIASFDHDVSDESSPETKQTARLPEIREDGAGGVRSELGLVPEAGGRARSHSTPGPTQPPPPPGLCAAAPRIDISRASSSSHHDSRDSSPELPELALLAEGAGGTGRGDHLGFREDGALDLRSSTEELAFLEQEPAPAPGPVAPPPIPQQPPLPRRHSRKDSQGSEAALLLGISGRTSRLSSVGSQCSAMSAISAMSGAGRVSRLSVTSGASRSPSPHKMLLETSFCGPKPIETDPDVCAAAVEERLLELAKRQAFPMEANTSPVVVAEAEPDARDRRSVCTEVTVEPAPPEPRAPRPARDRDRRPRPDPGIPLVHEPRNRSKDVIRIRLKPDEEYDDDDRDDDDNDEVSGGARALAPPAAGGSKPETLTLRSPSPAPAPTSRKSSFCSLFKSRETIASPDSPSDALRRKKSLPDGGERSKSRERAASAASGKLRGSVLSLFKTPRRSAAEQAGAAGPSRSGAASPALTGHVPPAAAAGAGLKYYEAARDGIIHIPLHTPPDEPPAPTETARPASAPCRPTPGALQSASAAPHPPPVRRTVLPDGSIIIPLHSPTECVPPEPSSGIVPAESPSVRPASAEGAVVSVGSPAPETGSESNASPPGPSSEPEAILASASGAEDTHARRKERLMFSTHVGSAEQVFCTQFSITKTPSVASEMSESFPSLAEEPRVLRETHVTSDSEPPRPPSARRYTPPQSCETAAAAARWSVDIQAVTSASVSPTAAGMGMGTGTGAESPGASSSSSGGGGVPVTAAVVGPSGPSETEQRGLVVQESFEELPYVPTTLPQERSLALPMLPVRERGPQLQTTASVSRPRAGRGSVSAPPPPPPVPPPPLPADAPRLTIRLPGPSTRRSRSATTSATATPPRPPGWVDFTEIPERRTAARRITTVGTTYVAPEECRCECHRTAAPAANGGADDDTAGGAAGGVSR